MDLNIFLGAGIQVDANLIDQRQNGEIVVDITGQQKWPVKKVPGFFQLIMGAWVFSTNDDTWGVPDD